MKQNFAHALLEAFRCVTSNAPSPLGFHIRIGMERIPKFRQQPPKTEKNSMVTSGDAVELPDKAMEESNFWRYFAITS